MIRFTRQFDADEFLALIRDIDPLGIAPRSMWERAERLHNRFFTITLDLPHRPRSLKSNRKFHKLVHLLCPILTLNFDECKMTLKMEATAMGYGMVEKNIGKHKTMIPRSEADASQEEENMLIETALRIGAECGHDLERILKKE